jgi:hypothetical protein
LIGIRRSRFVSRSCDLPSGVAQGRGYIRLAGAHGIDAQKWTMKLTTFAVASLLVLWACGPRPAYAQAAPEPPANGGAAGTASGAQAAHNERIGTINAHPARSIEVCNP